MPKTRSFFDIRYTIPGYTFILYFIFLNLEAFVFILLKLAELDSIVLFGILFGFITLLSGAALGFLVSQPWHAINNRFFKNKSYEKINKSIKQKLSLAEMDHKLLSTKNEQLISYLMRRWDLYNLMGSLLSAIGLATLFGWLISLTILADYKLSLVLYVNVHFVYTIVIIFSIIIISAIIVDMFTVVKEWVDMSTLIIDPKLEVIDY